MSLSQANIDEDIPLIFSKDETFDVRVLEEGVIDNFKASFSGEGLFEWAKIQKNIKEKYLHETTSPDSLGDPCGMWY